MLLHSSKRRRFFYPPSEFSNTDIKSRYIPPWKPYRDAIWKPTSKRTIFTLVTGSFLKKHIPDSVKIYILLVRRKYVSQVMLYVAKNVQRYYDRLESFNEEKN